MALLCWNNLSGNDLIRNDSSWKKYLSRVNLPSRRLCVAFSVAILLLSLRALADVPVEGMKQVSYDYAISNIRDYPDYVFLTSSAIWGWKYASVINSTGTFGGGYKLDRYEMHAIKALDFDRQEFFAARDEYNEEIANCTDYCRNNPMIVSSNLALPKATSVNLTMPIEKIEVLLRVNGITDRTLELSKTRMLYYYENGTVQEHPPE